MDTIAFNSATRELCLGETSIVPRLIRLQSQYSFKDNYEKKQRRDRDGWLRQTKQTKDTYINFE